MSQNDGTTLHLHEFLPYRLFVLASRISQSLAKHYEERFNISRPEWRVIAVLGETPHLSAAQVADRTAMDKVAISRAVSKLLGAELLQRNFSEQDKRRSELSLSSSGIAVYQKIAPIALKYEKMILDQLSDGEQKLLTKVLTKLDALDLDFDNECE